MSTLQIYLLGEFKLLHGDDEPLSLPATLKAQSLLAYLVTHRDRPCSREMLAALFWPDRPGDKTLRSLSTALWHVRRVLPPGDYILADAHTVQFNPHSDYWLDVDAFTSKSQVPVPELQGGTPGIEGWDSIAALMQDAIALYRGDFLEHLYDDWCLEERYRLEARYLEALERLVAAHQALGQPQAALRDTQLLLARDPLREDVHRTAIQLHVQLGHRMEALRQAWWCRAVLRSELGVEPQPETLALCDELLGPAWRRESGAETSAQHSPLPHSQPALILESPPFVGREVEWRAMLAHWEQVRSGQGRVVLVSGEAGIGKTRLAEELSQYVRQRGHWVFYGRCYEYERTLPYGLLADTLRAILSVTGASVLERLPAWRVAELARLAPELGERLSPPPRAGELREGEPAGQHQTRLFDALTLFLLDLARQAPLLLVLEDLHWINDSALAWLHYLARRLSRAPVLLLATYRYGEASPGPSLHGLALQLEQEGLATQLELARLPRQTVARWMAGASDPLVSRVYHQTEGNPLFILQTLRTLCEEGRIRLVEGRWVEETPPASLPIPASVRQVIRHRLERLSSPAREAASVAAVIGRTFDFDVWEQAWGQGEEPTLEALDELLRCHLVREGARSLTRDYEFDHHLVREVIYQGLHHRRRRRFHRLVGQALQRLYADRPGVAGELAYHFEHAHETESALAWLVAAGEEAQRGYAPQEALAYFRRAWALLDSERADSLAARALTGLATAHRDVVGEEDVVWEWLERALSIWEALGDRAKTAEVCYALASRYADFERARAQVRRGLQAVQGLDGLEKMVAQGYGLLARFYEHGGDFASAYLWAHRQRELSERTGDQTGLAHTYHRLGSLLLRVGGPMSEAVAHARQAARLAQGLGWLDFAAGSHNIAGYCLLALGRTAEAEQACRLALRLSTGLDIPWRQCWAYHCLAQIASLRGEWEEASRLLDQAEERMIHQPTHFQELALLRARGQLAARQGHLTAARPLLETALQMAQRFYPRYVPRLELRLAALSLEEGNHASAHQRLQQAREHAQHGDTAYALAMAGRLQGQLAALTGDWSTAEVAFANSLRQWEELEQAIEAARTRLAWGQVLLSHDPARARPLLESALAAFEAAEARPEATATRRLLA
jgi:DNA-binding SARP family transcriptional activator/tetratricopeptide (TPR) repeat protein